MKNTLLTEVRKDLREAYRSIIEQLIIEGVDDPGILHALFMAGSPASGKSYVAAKTAGVPKLSTPKITADGLENIFGMDSLRKAMNQSFAHSGLKVVNSDIMFHHMLLKNGIDPKQLAAIEKADPAFYDTITGPGPSIRNIAKKLSDKQKAFYEAGRLGMIVDGTGDSVDKISRSKTHAEEIGYDTYMIFVNTALDVALERNRKRGESGDRVLPDSLVTEKWKACQNNIGHFQGMFSGRFIVVDNTVYKDDFSSDIYKAIDHFIAEPVRNPVGKKWILQAKALKASKLIK